MNVHMKMSGPSQAAAELALKLGAVYNIEAGDDLFRKIAFGYFILEHDAPESFRALQIVADLMLTQGSIPDVDYAALAKEWLDERDVELRQKLFNAFVAPRLKKEVGDG